MHTLSHSPGSSAAHHFADAEKNHRILIVDDNEAIHDDFRKILGTASDDAAFDSEEADFFGEVANTPRRASFEMSFASQGQQALAMVQAAMRAGRRYSLVFTDVRMPPGWDGLETALKLWEADPDLQIVICTAYSDKSWEEMMEKLGNPERVLILKKPFDTIEVLQLAHALTEKWSLLQSSRRNTEQLERTVSARTAELQASEQRFRALSESAPIGIMELDATGRLIYSNAYWAKVSGYTTEDLSGTGWSDAIHPEDAALVWENWKETMATGGSYDAEHRHYQKDGQLRWVHVRQTPIRSEAGEVTGYVGTIEDITDRRATELELARARDAAVESAELKSRFLANMSHEIRTPMNGIIGMTELVLDTDLNREQREYLEMAKSSAHALLALINDILDFSKIEAGKLELESISFSLRDCLAATLKPLGMRADQKGIELTAEIPAGVPDHFLGDPMRLRQIIINLTDNAIKFTERGDVMLRVSVDSTEGDMQLLHFAVTDTGIGIPEDKQAVIFDAFSQADGTTTRTYGGTGLGLAIASQLVGHMGGRIWLESTVGQGTTFHFTAQLPVRHTTAPSGPQADPAALEGMRVLVVDDNAVNRRILREMLSNWRMEPSVVGSGAAAIVEMLQAARSGVPFPLVILDAMMPEMDGFMVAQKIREHAELSGATVMMLSSAMPSGAFARCAELGVASYLMKPVSQGELVEAILAAVGGGEKRAPISALNGDPRPPSSLRILLAEDNVINRALAAAILEKRGHSLVHAANGREALEAAEREAFDLIFMDVQMPEMDGFEATARIREMEKTTGRHTPIVAMTAHAITGDRERCLDAGMDEYISKPLEKPRLLELLARFSAARQSEAKDAPVTVENSPKIEETPPTYSREKLLDELDDDELLMQRMIALFHENTPRLLDDIRSAVARRDADALARSAHALLSSLGAFGADRARHLAQQLEAQGQANDFEHTDRTFADLERATLEVHTALAAFARN